MNVEIMQGIHFEKTAYGKWLDSFIYACIFHVYQQ